MGELYQILFWIFGILLTLQSPFRSLNEIRVEPEDGVTWSSSRVAPADRIVRVPNSSWYSLFRKKVEYRDNYVLYWT